MNQKNPAQKKVHGVSSWAEWFDRCAKYYQDPRMKMAYYEDGKPVAMKVMRAIHEDVWKKMGATKNSTVLDVGGGIGLFSQPFQHRVKRIIGTDISPTMIRDAYKLNPKGTFLLCAASSLPFSNESFDRVLCYSVFHYLPNPSRATKVLNEFMRVVNEDGLVFIGDILYPEGYLKRKDHSGISKQSNQRHTMWWPSLLNHDLEKLTFPPSFFINYAKKNGCRCKILTQKITGKETTVSRYDVILRF